MPNVHLKFASEAPQSKGSLVRPRKRGVKVLHSRCLPTLAPIAPPGPHDAVLAAVRLHCASCYDALRYPAVRRPEAPAVLSQLERILASDGFQHSRRYPALLRHVVEKTVAGETDDLKERVLGIAVFGRAPDYDTSSDPVVRTTASEVRKRLEDYYSKADRAGELRITLPVGTYIPIFRNAAAPIAENAPSPGMPWRRIRQILVPAAAILLLATAGFALVSRLHSDRAPLHQFWAPTLKNSPVLVVMETLMGVPKSAGASDTHQVTEILDPKLYLIVNDSNSRLASYFASNGSSLEYELARNITLARLRPHPFILRGAFNNPLTLQAVASFPYYLNLDRNTLVRQIVDRQAPARHWDAPLSGTLSRDYALIARAPEPRSGQTMFVIAGLGERGGAAATEFVTNPHDMDLFAAQAPKGWEDRNLEIVIETDLENGDWGAPKIVASKVW